MRPMVISARLFPAGVVARAKRMVSPSLYVKVSPLAGDRVMVQLAGVNGPGGRDASERFKAALTAAAIRYFSAFAPEAGAAAAERLILPGDWHVKLSLDMAGATVLVSLDASQWLWPRVLRALSRLQLAQPVVQSTDPVDRVVLVLHLRDGGPVEDALREFVALLRAELEGPAA